MPARTPGAAAPAQVTIAVAGTRLVFSSAGTAGAGSNCPL